MSLIPFDKWSRLGRMIKQSGGPFGAFYQFWRTDTLKDGKLMGCDSMGNKYYENRIYMIGRSRWVDFNMSVRWDYNASQVSPEWYGWLHYKTDLLPHQDWAKYDICCCCWCHRWLMPYQENASGTEQAYYPYSTQRPHINLWDGTSICNRGSCDGSCE